MKRTTSYLALGIAAGLLLSSGAVWAQGAQVPFTNDENATALTATIPGGGFATTPGAPYANAPGASPTTLGAYILGGENNAGAITTSVANAVTASGVPNVTYANETAAATAYAAPSGGGLANIGGTYATGDYVISTSGANNGALLTSGQIAACTNTTCSYVAPTAVDGSVSWQKVNYANEISYATAYQGTGANAGSVLIDSKGNMIQAGTLTGLNLGGAAPTGYSWVSAATTPDPTATAKSVASADYAFTKVAAIGVIGNSQSIAGPGSLVQQNTDAKGNVLASTAVGPTGVSVVNGVAGHSTSVGAGIVTVTNGSNSGAYISLDATQDPVLTVTNGTAAGTTTINNGTVTAGTSINAPTVNATSVVAKTVTATTVNATTVNAATVNAGYVGAETLATVDSAGTVYGNVGNTLTSQQSQINNLANYTHNQVKILSGGVAIAFASTSPQVDPGKHFAVSANFADFNGQPAGAFDGKLRINDTWFGTAGVGFSGNGQVAGKVGIQAQW